ncbi:MAG: hypothetical protein ACXV8Q_17180 [Methylobacter sp.]
MHSTTCFKEDSQLTKRRFNAKLLFGGVLCLFSLLTVLPVSAAPFVYVTNNVSGSVSVIDMANNSLVDTVTVGHTPIGVAVSPDGKRVYVANISDNTVSVIDTTTNTVVATIFDADKMHRPNFLAVTPDGKRVYVTNLSGTNVVSVIDTATNTVVDSVKDFDAQYGVAVRPDGKRVYVTHSGYPGFVSVIDTKSNTVVDRVDVGINSAALAVTPDGKHLYVTGGGGAGDGSIFSVSIIDTTTNTVVNTIEDMGLNPKGVAVTPDGKRVYVTNTSGFISVIDTATNIFVSKIALDSAWGVAVAPDGKRVYVGNYSNKATLSVIDSTTNTVVDKVVLGEGSIGPGYLAITPAPISTSFSNFKVNQLTINKRLGSLFMLSHLKLGQGNNGIDPLTEPVTLSIGNATVKIPSGSFHKIHNLPYSFVGEIDNIWVEVLINPLGGNQFGVQVAEYGTQISRIVKPIEIKLTIGDDTGTTSYK